MTVLNLQVAASGDDGFWTQGEDVFDTEFFWLLSVGIGWQGDPGHAFARFSGLSGLAGVTINSAVFSVFVTNPGDPAEEMRTKVSANDAESPAAPTSAADANAKASTSSQVDWDGPFTNNDWNEQQITPVIAELVSNYDPSSILLLHKDDGSANESGVFSYSDFDGPSGNSPKLDIDYTAPAGDEDDWPKSHLAISAGLGIGL